MDLTSLAKQPGVIAVAAAPADNPHPPFRFAGDSAEAWANMLSAAVLLLTHTAAHELRVVVAASTIYVQRERDTVYAVCIPTGHDFGKSIHRAIRRASKAVKA